MLLPTPDDFHVHLRQDEALPGYVADCARHFGRALVMPNTLPPVRDAAGLAAYRHAIVATAAAAGHPGFTPLMSFKLFPDLQPADLAALKAAGAVAGKLYPQGATTNAQDGVADIAALWPVFSVMEDLGLVLCLHGEDPGAFSLDREAAFLPAVKRIVAAFPRLRVVLEHVSTRAGLEFVLAGPATLGASLTVHHLLANLDDLIGGHLQPHLFCKPVLKRPEDQDFLRQVALTAPARVFFGSDSAPHLRVAKECDCGAAGIYTMPVALPLLAGLFAEAGDFPALTRFVSTNGAAFYTLEPATTTVELVEESWTVPAEYRGVVPFMAGRTLNWSVR